MRVVIVLLLLAFVVIAIALFISDRKEKRLGEIRLAGLGFRTTNADLIETGGFRLKSAIEEVVSSKANIGGKMFIVYGDYEDGFASDLMNKQFNVFVGFELIDQEVGEGISNMVIPPQKYVVFRSEKGAAQKVVPDAWQKIWSDRELQKRRSFAYDFELHEQNLSTEAQVEIYIGIK